MVSNKQAKAESAPALEQTEVVTMGEYIGRTIVVLCMIGAAHGACCLARIALPYVYRNLCTFVKSIFWPATSSVDNVIEGGLALQFAPVVRYARASQLEHLDQQAAQWIKETRAHILGALTSSFVQAASTNLQEVTSRDHPTWIKKASEQLTLPPYPIPLSLNEYMLPFSWSIGKMLREQGFTSYEVNRVTINWDGGCVPGTSGCPSYNRHLDVKVSFPDVGEVRQPSIPL